MGRSQVRPIKNSAEAGFMVGATRLELATSTSQKLRATNCATPRRPNLLYHAFQGIATPIPKLTAKSYL